MVISFEENDRKKIEATGMSIIRVKQIIYKFFDSIDKFMQVLNEYYNRISPEQQAEFIKSIISED